MAPTAVEAKALNPRTGLNHSTPMPQTLTLKAKEPQAPEEETGPEGEGRICINEKDAPGGMTEKILIVPTTGPTLILEEQQDC